MTEDVRILVPGLIAAGVGAAPGRLARGSLGKRRLRREQAFSGLPGNAESLLVVGREAGGPELTVRRHDVFAPRREPGPDRGAFRIGAERYRLEPGIAEDVVLARLTAGRAGDAAGLPLLRPLLKLRL